MLVDVELVLDQLVLDGLLQVSALGAQLRQAIHDILHKVEAVQLILHPDVEGRRDGALLLVAPDVEVAVGPAVGQPVHQPRVPVEAEDDGLVLGEERIVVILA